MLSVAMNEEILFTRFVWMSVCRKKDCAVESQRYTTEVWGLLTTSPRLLANTSRVSEWSCRTLTSTAPWVSILWCSENFRLAPSLYTIELETIQNTCTYQDIFVIFIFNHFFLTDIGSYLTIPSKGRIIYMLSLSGLYV